MDQRREEEKRERREERDGPLDAQNNMTTHKTPGNGQKQSQQVLTQHTTQEADKSSDTKQVKTNAGIPIETIATGSGKRTMKGDENRKDEEEGKQTSAVQHIKNMEKASPHDSKNSDTNIQTMNPWHRRT
jgi:hypothetical protein